MFLTLSLINVERDRVVMGNRCQDCGQWYNNTTSIDSIPRILGLFGSLDSHLINSRTRSNLGKTNLILLIIILVWRRNTELPMSFGIRITPYLMKINNAVFFWNIQSTICISFTIENCIIYMKFTKLYSNIIVILSKKEDTV